VYVDTSAAALRVCDAPTASLTGYCCLSAAMQTQVAAAGWSGGSGLLAFQNPLGWSATQILTSPFSAPPNVSPLRGSPHAASMQGLGPGQSPAAPATAPVAPYNSPFQQVGTDRPHERAPHFMNSTGLQPPRWFPLAPHAAALPSPLPPTLVLFACLLLTMWPFK
jgi:hypothetical protein